MTDPRIPVKPPTLQNTVDYAVEAFVDENDRQPNAEELAAITKEAEQQVDEAQEVYDEWKAAGKFVCCICDEVHRHHAPPGCCAAYNAGL